MACKKKKPKPRRWMVMLPFVVLLPSCSMMKNADEALAKLNDGLGKVNAVVAKVEQISAVTQAKLDEVKANADTDKDGSISWGELLAYLFGAGGVLGVGGKLAYSALQRQLDEVYDRTHRPLVPPV